MYSPFAALFRDSYWGGVPISLFAVGAFAFFAAFALYLLLTGPAAPRRAPAFFAATAETPLLVSIVMFTISLLRLGHFCKTCVGIYASSFVLAIAAVLVYLDARSRDHADAQERGYDGAFGGAKRDPAAAPPSDPVWMPIAWLAALGVAAIAPALLYIGAVPTYGH